MRVAPGRRPRRGVGRGTDPGAHREDIDRRARGDQVLDPVLVQPAADHDARPGQPGRVEGAPGLEGEGGQVAAVQPDPAGTVPGQLPQYLGGGAHAPVGVVGVDEQRHRPGGVLDERPERFRLVGEHLHERMRHRPRRRQPVAPRRGDVAGPGEPDQGARSGGLHPGLHALAAPQREVHHRRAPGRDHAAGRLAGQRGLVHQLVEQERLHQLGLWQHSGDLQQRLTGQDHPPLGDRPDISGEAQPVQRGHVLHRAGQRVGERGQLRRADLEVFEEVQHIGQACGHQEAPLRREVAHREAEGGLAGTALTQIGQCHGHLVQVGDQGCGRRAAPDGRHGHSPTLAVPAGPRQRPCALPSGDLRTAPMGTFRAKRLSG
jgi:hypothetical protein